MQRYTKSSFFLRYLQERHLFGSSRTQSMYFRQKEAHFQLHLFGFLISSLHGEFRISKMTDYNYCFDNGINYSQSFCLFFITETTECERHKNSRLLAIRCTHIQGADSELEPALSRLKAL